MSKDSTPETMRALFPQLTAEEAEIAAHHWQAFACALNRIRHRLAQEESYPHAKPLHDPKT